MNRPPLESCLAKKVGVRCALALVDDATGLVQHYDDLAMVLHHESRKREVEIPVHDEKVRVRDVFVPSARGSTFRGRVGRLA